MSLALLVDFGSTFTKLTVLDTHDDVRALVARAAVPTTTADITVGLRNGLERLQRSGIEAADCSLKLACSSAAGGLRMVAVGLVPELTAEAARRAALGAGARVVGVFAGLLGAADVERIARLQPDMLLLAGGTDGGNERALSHNATRLVNGPAGLLHVPVVIAGNSDAAPGAEAVLAAAGVDVRVTDNVMPELGVINVEPARAAIRTLFLERIVTAKGLDAAEQFVEGVLMPTPAAVLAAARLLAEGTERQAGLGDLVLVDVGGATTDVHSIGAGETPEAHVTNKGLPEPLAKRTVEGDLGVRVSAAALVEVVGVDVVVKLVGTRLSAGEVTAVVERWTRQPETLPETPGEQLLDLTLARLAAAEAMGRHAGRMEERLTALGIRRFLTGKDLRSVRCVIGTGGVIVHSAEPAHVLGACLFSDEYPHVLLPQQPQLLVDDDYILSACGLLAERVPDTALAILKQNLRSAV